MTKKEYKDKQECLRIEFDTKLGELANEYALANNTIHPGDVIADHIGTIAVTKILTTRGFDSPECVYIGVNYTKSGTISKREPKRTVYQCNLINQ